jgi:hypothetical protein
LEIRSEKPGIPSPGKEIGMLFSGRSYGGNEKKRRAPGRRVKLVAAPPIFGSQEAKGERRVFLGENHSGLGLKEQIPDAAA